MEKKEDVCHSMEEIIDVYADMVFRIVLQHMQNEADTQDVVQDVFMKIMKKKPVFTHPYQEKAWILKVAMNTCKDHWRYEKLRQHEELLENDHSRKETKEPLYVLPYVIQLPQKYRDVIYLYYYEAYDIKEIANILEKKPATISTWLARARKKLKAKLKESDLYEDEEI